MKPLPEKPLILDACCGSRMFWFDKNNESVVYLDKRIESHVRDLGTPGTVGRKPTVIRPDIKASFRQLPFQSDVFDHVVFDPPHLISEKATSVMMRQYGILRDDWEDQIRSGFSECFRVLKMHRILIFKWCETDYPLKKVLELSSERPLYGHKSGKAARTHWVAFMKTKPNIDWIFGC